ncbi:hypothetical protein SFRURICE_010902 [Spodoptera frugiperda]|uniref:SFRICE_009251 n=1 Tax=Spodoptera frugiperda TaxID=7108 RepID=A0A2H1WFB8_SPOFR|nr:hypothetical protein SFRURICE_010902 [Spodoptera frugiperda]
MFRLSAVVLLIVLAQVLTATVISSNEPKGVEVAGETLDAAAVVPLVQTNSLPELKKCAELGEPCIYHNDCCSRACLGFAKKCVT